MRTTHAFAEKCANIFSFGVRNTRSCREMVYIKFLSSLATNKEPFLFGKSLHVEREQVRESIARNTEIYLLSSLL